MYLSCILFILFTVSIKPLTELEHLNLAYNNLQRAPVLGLSAQAKLTTLILKNNELETINGEFSAHLQNCISMVIYFHYILL